MKIFWIGLFFILLIKGSFSSGEISWVPERINAPGLELRVFESVSLKAVVGYHVLFPPSYPDFSCKSYPVLYWLHGSGSGTAGIRYLALRFRRTMSEGLMPQMIVVFPYSPDGGMFASMWIDSKDGKTPVETVFVREIITNVDLNFRTVPKREGRIIEGYSMGGYGAARIGFKYNEMFSAVSVVAGGPLQQEFNFSPRVSKRRRESLFRRVYGGDMEYFRLESPWFLVEQNAEFIRGNMRIRLVIGEMDEMFEVNRLFHEHLEKLGISHEFIILPGTGHNALQVLQSFGDSSFKFYMQAMED